MADGNGGIPGQQQVQHRLAHDIAASHYHGFLSFYRNARQLQHLQAAVGSAGQQGLLSLHHAAHIDRVEAVHILHRVNAVQDFRFGRAQSLGQGQLHQDAVDFPVLVQAVNPGQDFLFRALLRHLNDLGVDAQFLTGLVLVPHIDLGSRVMAHNDDRQPRAHAVFFLQPVCPFFGIFFELPGKNFSFQ